MYGENHKEKIKKRSTDTAITKRHSKRYIKEEMVARRYVIAVNRDKRPPSSYSSSFVTHMQKTTTTKYIYIETNQNNIKIYLL